MARQISVIKQEMMDIKATIPALDGLTSTSQVAIFGNIFYVIAVEVSILEQLIDAYIASIEDIINTQAVGSAPWLRAKALLFQYGDFVELNTTTFSIGYPVLDVTKQILTRVSVKEVGNLIVQVKVAKAEPPVALAGPEITALANYIDKIKPAGTQINVVSLDSDKLYIAGTVYYNGQYSSVIQTNVEAALADYMANLSNSINFDGVVSVVGIVDAIQKVAGVTDVNISEIGGRPDVTMFASRTVIFKLSSGVNVRQYETHAGYIVEETTSGQTFLDKINYVAI